MLQYGRIGNGRRHFISNIKLKMAVLQQCTHSRIKISPFLFVFIYGISDTNWVQMGRHNRIPTRLFFNNCDILTPGNCWENRRDLWLNWRKWMSWNDGDPRCNAFNGFIHTSKRQNNCIDSRLLSHVSIKLPTDTNNYFRYVSGF